MYMRILMAGLLLFSVSLANAGNANYSAQALILLEHRWVDANQTHDIQVLKTILAKNYIDNTYRGTSRTKAQVLSGRRAGAGYLFAGFKEIKVRFFGNTGIVTGIAAYKKKGGTQSAKIRFTDVFRYGHSVWKVVSSQETLVVTH